jgi:2-polyprenyl-6-hydroxyphenyl methylase/3-demethylubiquinone-9 3-methyltransferase
MNSIDEAIDKIEAIVKSSNNSNDLTYFMYHKARFKKMGESVTAVCPPGSTVLDIGSHYLHSSLLLHFLGYKVTCMDVTEFCTLPFIQERASAHQLVQLEENNLEKLSSLPHQNDAFDLILFTEIFEHITFNPIGFWKRVHTLIKPNGFIYISTPNSFTLYAFIKTLYRLLTFKGIGLSVKDIFPTVTYGHHWKEYSADEIKTYFGIMNDGFSVSIKKFCYKPDESDGSLKSKGRVWLIHLGNRIPFFKEAMEVMVKVNKNHPFKVDIPQY